MHLAETQATRGLVVAVSQLEEQTAQGCGLWGYRGTGREKPHPPVTPEQEPGDLECWNQDCI